MQIWTWFVMFWTSRAWMPIAILAIGYFARLCATDTKFPINIPARWQPLFVLALGQLYAILVAVSGGLGWGAASVHGLETAVWTMGLFDVLVKAIWNGTEPTWLQLVIGIVQSEIPKPTPEPKWQGPKRG